MRLELVCMKNTEKLFDGDNGKFTCQECRRVEITERIFPKVLENLFELQRFELRTGYYESFLRKFHGDLKFA